MLRFNVLGPLEVLAGDRSLTIPAGKQRMLMAALLLDANRAVSADLLIDHLWGGQPGSAAAKNLQVLVSQLRKLLADDGDGPIATVSSGYLLRVAPGATDVDRFEELLAHARDQLDGGRPRDAERALDEALALWRGGAYQDVAYEDFARDEIARLEDRRLHAIEQRFEAMLAGGRHADAVADLERLAMEHPLRERPTALLMLALYRSGRQAEALEAYERARRYLSEQLGLEPGPGLRDLHDSILRHDPELGAADRPALTRPARSRRSWPLLAGGGLLLVLAAVAAMTLHTRSDGSASIEAVAPDSVGLLDPGSGRLIAQFAVGRTPTRVVTDGGLAWTLNADGRTISRIDLDGSDEPVTVSPGETPVSVEIGGGSLWVGYVQRRLNSGEFNGTFTAGVMQLDPDTLAERARFRLPGTGQLGGDLVGLTYGLGALWVGAPNGDLLGYDARKLRILKRIHDVYPVELTTGLGRVWAVTYRGSPQVWAIDPGTERVTRRISVHAPALEDIVVAAGSAWVADPVSGDVWRIDPGPPLYTRSISVGGSALGLAQADGALWATSGIDGTVTRILPNGESIKLRRFVVGNSPSGVAVSSRGILFTVAGGAGPAVGGSATDVASLPEASCGRVLHGSRQPEYLIVADLPITETFAGTTLPMVQAVIFTLRKHNFMAGRYPLGFQACDDATAVTGLWSDAKCISNARSYVVTQTVLGVLGTFNSACAFDQLPILNKAGPLPLVSPANSAIGLTHPLPGVPRRDFDSVRPSGKPGFVRVYPGDDVQAVAEAELADRLGLRHVLVYQDFQDDTYGASIAYAFRTAARRRGIHVTGPVVPLGHYDAVIDRIASDHVDGVLLAGGAQPNDAMVRFVHALRKRLGKSVTLIADDFFLPTSVPLGLFGKDADGMYVSGGYITDPARQLPPAGAEFVRSFSATQPGRVVNIFTPYAAQATEVLLAAIAKSNGTRASVMQQLLKVRVSDGILGSFGFDANGDMTSVDMSIIRVDASRPAGLPDPVFAVLRGLHGLQTTR